MAKILAEVTAVHDINGNIRPLSFKPILDDNSPWGIWQDGETYTIGRVTNVCMAASLKSGGQGMRYTFRIHGKEVYLFCDEGRWFLES